MLRRIVLLALAFTVLGVSPASAAVTGTTEPASDLVDQQLIRVVVDGLPAQEGGTWVEILPCRVPITDRATDCAPYGPYRHVNPAGLLRARIAVRSRLLLPGGSEDCRADTCGLRVAIDGGADAAIVLPLDFDPSGLIPDPPDVTAAPTTGLVDGQRLVVDGTGLAQFDTVELAFCPSGGAEADCLHLPTGTFSDETGQFSQPVSAWAVLHPRGGATTDCRVANCVLRASFAYGIAAPIEIPLTFDPGGDVLVPAVDVRPHTDLGPRQSVTVRLTGFHDLGGEVRVQQCLGRPGTPPDWRRCRTGGVERLRPQDGFTRVSLRRVMTTPAGPVDCGARRCHIWVGRTLEAPALASDRLVFHPRH